MEEGNQLFKRWLKKLAKCKVFSNPGRPEWGRNELLLVCWEIPGSLKGSDSTTEVPIPCQNTGTRWIIWAMRWDGCNMCVGLCVCVSVYVSTYSEIQSKYMYIYGWIYIYARCIQRFRGHFQKCKLFFVVKWSNMYTLFYILKAMPIWDIHTPVLPWGLMLAFPF